VKVVVNGFSKVRREWIVENRILEEHFICFIFDKKLKLVIEGKEYLCGKNSFFWIKPGSKHSIELRKKELPMVLYHIRIVLDQDFISDLRKSPNIVIQHGECFKPLVTCLHEELKYQHLHQRDMVMSLFMQININAQRYLTSVEDHLIKLTPQQQHYFEQVSRECEYHDIDLNQIAKKSGMGLDYFSRIFKNTYGKAPRFWLNCERVNRAAVWLLESNESVSQIAERMAYSDIYNFSKEFKKVMLCSPSEYRRKFRLDLK